MEIKDVFQGLFWALSLLLVAGTLAKAAQELHEKGIWERAKLAKEIVDGLDKNTKALDATYMMGGWEDRFYVIPYRFTGIEVKTQYEMITHDEVIKSLKKMNTVDAAKALYIRDCFDNLLFELERMLVSSENKLVSWGDLQPLILTWFAGSDQPDEIKQALKNFAELGRYGHIAARLDSLFPSATTKAT